MPFRRPVGRKQNPRARREPDALAAPKISPRTESLSGCNVPRGEDLLTLQQLIDMLKMSRSAVYAAMQRLGFPRPIRTGPRDRRWIARKVHAWLKSRPRAGSAPRSGRARR